MHGCRVILAPPPLLLLCDLSGPVMSPEKQILVLEACQDTLKPEDTMAEGTTRTGHFKTRGHYGRADYSNWTLLNQRALWQRALLELDTFKPEDTLAERTTRTGHYKTRGHYGRGHYSDRTLLNQKTLWH